MGFPEFSRQLLYALFTPSDGDAEHNHDDGRD